MFIAHNQPELPRCPCPGAERLRTSPIEFVCGTPDSQRSFENPLQQVKPGWGLTEFTTEFIYCYHLSNSIE